MPQIVGIINLTEDSFSDGGRFVDPARAIERGEQLIADGADWLDLGAESSNPAGQAVPEDLQLLRLRPVIQHFVGAGARVAVDTHRAGVMAQVLGWGAGMINDITALADPAAAAIVARHDVPVVMMYSRTGSERADTVEHNDDGLITTIEKFFRDRMAMVGAHGVRAERMILDPGLGFFLGPTPTPSLDVLRALPRLRSLGRPIYVSPSRKSFVGTIVGRPPAERGAGSLGAELWALHAGATYVRTHDVRAVADAWAVWRAIAKGV